MRSFFKLAVLLLSAALVFAVCISINFAVTFNQKPVLVIDPGHGGIDGGAVSNNNVSEKSINLSIGLKLRDIAKNNGWKVVMTREDDVSLGEAQKSIRSQKMSDLKLRKKTIDDANGDVAVSIHLNSFPQDSSCKGAQTFFPSDQEESLQEKSKMLSEFIQEELTVGLKVEKGRLAMKKNNVYIFKKPLCPIALVECGFLSNPNEETLLQDEQYQQQIAACIYKGIEKYYMQLTGKNMSIPGDNIVKSDDNDFSDNEINYND